MTVERLARAAPSALIIIEVCTGESVGLGEFEALRRSGASAVMAVHKALPELRVLVDAARIASVSLPRQIGPRLRLLGYPVPSGTETALELLVAGPISWSTRAWAEAAGGSVRSLERRCAEQWNVPSPRRWVELVRTIRVVQAIQIHSQRSGGSVEMLLGAFGCGTVRTARELLKKISGTSPGTARDLIGWYWIVEYWCHAFWGRPITHSARLVDSTPVT